MELCSYSSSNTLQHFLHPATEGERYTLLFHGNCPDGFSALGIAAFYLHAHCKAVMTYHPICPSQPKAWPSAESMAGTHILLLDVSVPAETRQAWLAAGAHCVGCIDHHEGNKEHWSAEEECPIDTTHCAAMLTYRLFYGDAPIPAWLESVDRIDRWDRPTFEDRCFREYMVALARMPISGKTIEALTTFQAFIAASEDPAAVNTIMEAGRISLAKKDAELFQLLTARGVVLDLTEEHLAVWGLGPHWLGARLFLMNNSEFVIDTTEAAHLVFEHHPMKPNVFINYRRSSWFDGPSGQKKEKVVYYGRSHVDHGINLAEGSVLKGHATAAGATLYLEEVRPYPFLL